MDPDPSALNMNPDKNWTDLKETFISFYFILTIYKLFPLTSSPKLETVPENCEKFALLQMLLREKY